MSEEEFLREYIERQFPNDHQIIYLYACGGKRSSANAIDKGIAWLSPIFSPTYPTFYLKRILTEYLEDKKSQYFKGEIQVVPIY